MVGSKLRWAAVSAAAAAMALGACSHMPLGHPKVIQTNACSATTVSLYFEPGSDDVTKLGRQIIGEAAKQLRGCPVQELMLVGLADPAGSPENNLELSRRRAEHVRDAFLAAGLPVERFTLAAAGDVGAVRPSGAIEPVRRRVDVTVVMKKPG